MIISGPIIVVDDDHDDHYILQSVCDKLGIGEHLRFFEDGIELVTYLRATDEKPFVILCDINMPRMDGMAVRKVIDSDEYLRSKSIPFIFFSTAATRDQVKQAYELTVQGFFTKGGSLEDTRRKLIRIIEYWGDARHPNSVM